MPVGQSDSGAFLAVAHSVSGKRWRARLEDERVALALAQQLEISEILARVLAARGITAEDAERFLNPALRDALREFAKDGSISGRPLAQKGRYYSHMPSVLKEICLKRFERHTNRLLEAA